MVCSRGESLTHHISEMNSAANFSKTCATLLASICLSANALYANPLYINNARTIHDLYNENELAAKQKYSEKYAIVSGRVDTVDTSDLIIEGDGEFGRLFCKFGNNDIAKVSALRNDDRVTVKGTLSLEPGWFGLELLMHDCRVE